MKKLLFLIYLLCIISAPVYAEHTCPDGYITTSSDIGHEHCYMSIDEHTEITNVTNVTNITEPQDEAGVGADVVLWQNEKEDALIEEVTAEYRRDLENDSNKIYGVVRVNLWEKLNDLFSKKDEE